MALANVAWILSLNGYRVLVIDWDLEAPGVYRYLHPFLEDKELVETEGLMDMLEKLAAHAAIAGDESEAKTEVRVINYVEPLRWPRESAFPLAWKQFGPRAGFDFMPAGRQGPAYSLKLNSFNWVDFYERLGGRRLLEEAKSQMRAIYDYVLIDSRTGVSDTSGICSVEMPDTLVICFTLNNQSVRGAAGVAASIRQQQGQTNASTLSRQFRIFPVPTRVEMTAEKDKREAALYLAKQTFSTFLDHMPKEALGDYWGAVQNSYFPYYAFEEIPAVFADDPYDRSSLASAFRYLTRAITEPSVERLPQFAPDPATDEKIRKEIVRWFLRPAPQTDAVQLVEQIYASFDPSSRATLKRIVLRLISISPNANPTARTAVWAEIAETDAWMAETLAERRLLVVRGTGEARDVRFNDPVVVERWETLRRWIDEDKDFLTWRAALAGPAQSWRVRGSDEPGILLRGKLLEEAEGWRRTRGEDLNGAEQAYITACLKADERARREEQLASAAAATARARLTELESLLSQRPTSSPEGHNMTSVAPVEERPTPEMLRFAWGEYRSWAATSRVLKARITNIGVIVLSLTILGTALGTLSPIIADRYGLNTLWAVKFLPWVAAAALGIAAFLTNQLLTESERQAWVKARALAEALKSESYKYATGAPPYDVPNASQRLTENVSELQRTMSGVLAEQVPAPEREKNLPEVPMSISSYIELRVLDQKDVYYPSGIRKHRARINQAKIVALVAGLVTVVLSGSSNTTSWAAPALGIVTTVAVGLAAWFQSGHHQQFALNYQDARTKLESFARAPPGCGPP